MRRIVFQGVPGCYSYLAARAHLPAYRADGLHDFKAVAAAVRAGKAEYAILPVENTVVGEIAATRDILANDPTLEVASEIRFPVNHCLLALPGADLSSIRWVESHPVALAQCSRWIEAQRLTARAVEDTAGAARAIAADRDYSRAAVAAAEAAELYGLTILARDIADVADNVTRFVIVRRQASQEVAA